MRGGGRGEGRGREGVGKGSNEKLGSRCSFYLLHSSN